MVLHRVFIGIFFDTFLPEEMQRNDYMQGPQLPANRKNERYLNLSINLRKIAALFRNVLSSTENDCNQLEENTFHLNS